MNRTYDFIIFGATGLTGYYSVKNLLKYNATLENKYTFAIAARNRQKLEKVLVEVSNELNQDVSNINIILADVNNKESILDMTKKCKVLICVIGPYELYAHVVIESCVETSTHYVDVSGETTFIDSIQLEFFDSAKEKEIYIVNSCGFDSIPADLGILYLKDQNLEYEFKSFSGYINVKNAKGYSVNTGTLESIICSIDKKKDSKSLKEQINKKFFNKRPYEDDSGKYSIGNFKRDKYKFSKSGFYFPFWPIDSIVTKKTQYMFYQDNENDKPAKLNEYLNMNGLLHSTGLVFLIFLFVYMCYFRVTRYMLRKYPSIFTFGFFRKGGPTKEQIDNSSLEFFLAGNGFMKNDKKIRTKVTLQIKAPEVAYDSTSIFLINSAITILKDLQNNQTNHGVVTPGYAFRNTEYIKRLADFGIEWKFFEEE